MLMKDNDIGILYLYPTVRPQAKFFSFWLLINYHFQNKESINKKSYILKKRLQGYTMTMLVKVSQNARTQTIQIPKEYKLESDEVYIDKIGDSLIIKPKYKNHWDSFFDTLQDIDSSNFLNNRTQLPVQEREMF